VRGRFQSSFSSTSWLHKGALECTYTVHIHRHRHINPLNPLAHALWRICLSLSLSVWLVTDPDPSRGCLSWCSQCAYSAWYRSKGGRSCLGACQGVVVVINRREARCRRVYSCWAIIWRRPYQPPKNLPRRRALPLQQWRCLEMRSILRDKQWNIHMWFFDSKLVSSTWTAFLFWNTSTKTNLQFCG